MNAPWNRKLTLSWTEFYYGDASTHPRNLEKVLAIDEIGNMAVCIFDHETRDFLLDTSGFCSDQIKSTVSLIVDSSIRRAIKELSLKNKQTKNIEFLLEKDDFGMSESDVAATESIIEESCNYGNCPSYFDSVSYWMPLPPVPLKVSIEGDAAETVNFAVFDIISAIEPHLRNAISSMITDDKDQA